VSETGGEGVLSRWSRRKAEAREQTAADNNLPEVGEQADLAVADEKLEPVEEPVLTDDDMPPIESLTEDSDYSMFMSRGVSDKLRNLALRKMFHVPSFNIRDGLDEYDEDYTFFEPLGDIVTSDMKHQIEMLEKKKQEAAEALALEEGEDEDIVEDMDEEEQQQALAESDEVDEADLEIVTSDKADEAELSENRCHE
jgi:hypothetical protein